MIVENDVKTKGLDMIPCVQIHKSFYVSIPIFLTLHFDL